MALSINWTEEAKLTYENILIYLQGEWSAKEIKDFIDRTEKLLLVIAQQPYAFKASRYKQMRKAVMGKHNSLFYLVTNQQIYLVTFWDNRLNPAQNKYSR